jgi:hypothetical protein
MSIQRINQQQPVFKNENKENEKSFENASRRLWPLHASPTKLLTN